jgi:shikimate kinase
LAQDSVVLIGMPGAGKSTIGILLAKDLGLDFLDTDVLIQVQQKQTLQQILEAHGYKKLRAIEEQAILGLQTGARVISTGGSAVYGDRAMAKLQATASIVFIDVTLATLRQRIHNYDSRGVARRPEQSFEDLFEERKSLYANYANIVISGDNKTPLEIVEAIKLELAFS